MILVTTDHSAQMSQENFVTEFLKHCEESNVELLPRFVVNFYKLFNIIITCISDVSLIFKYCTFADKEWHRISNIGIRKVTTYFDYK